MFELDGSGSQKQSVMCTRGLQSTEAKRNLSCSGS